jgi:hypothetical protein
MLDTQKQRGAKSQYNACFCEMRRVFLEALAKLLKATLNLIIFVCLHVHLSVRMEQLSSHWADFHKI